MQRVSPRPDLAESPPRARRAETAQGSVILGAAVLLIVLAFVVRLTIAIEYRREAQGVLEDIERTAQQLASRTGEVFDRVDQVTRLIKHLREAGAPASALASLRRAGVLADELVRGVVVADAQGRIVDASGTVAGATWDLAADAAYARLRARDTGAIDVGLTAPNPIVAGAAVLPVMRRLNRADGAFDGAVIVLVDPQALTSQNAATEARDTAFGVVGADGVFRVRMLGGRLSYGERLDLTQVQTRTRRVRETLQPLAMPSSPSGRFATNVRVENYPLIAVIAADADTALAGYRRSRALIVSWAAAVALLVAGGAGVLWLRVREVEASRNLTRRTEAALRATLEGSLDAVSIMRARRDDAGELVDLVIVDTNVRAAALHGGTPATVIGRGLCELRPTIRRIGHLERVAQVIRERRPVSVELQAVDADLEGRWLHHHFVPLDDVDGVAMITRDITERKDAEFALASLARTDPLTQLGNRREFEQRLAEARARAQRSRQPLAVLYLDLDDFKGVNDRLGHAVGDRVLIGVAERLREGVRATDAVSRLGGDEFAAVLENAGSVMDLAMLCQRLVASVALPHRIERVGELVCTPSIGAAVLRPNETLEALVQRADAAMYAAKQAGKCAYRIDDGEVVAEVPARASIC